MNTAKEKTLQTTLCNLIEGLVVIPNAAEIDRPITGIQLDSRLVKNGDLFIACFGRNHDARNYVDQAIRSGCAAVVAEFTAGTQELKMIGSIPVIGTHNLSSKVSEIANRFYQYPSAELKIIGITGTNGKTSCSQFIADTLQGLGYKCGMMGTLGSGQPGSLEPSELTTPDPVFSQKQLARMVNERSDYVAMEVSSVGLDQKRVEAIDFDTAVFTNLTRDHLDYHKTMEEYAKSKKKLFKWPTLKAAILNLDDEFSLSLINSVSKEVEIVTYSLSNHHASVFSEGLTFSGSGYSMIVNTPFGNMELSGRLLGRFNISNILAVIATLISLLSREGKGHIDLVKILDEVSSLDSVDGRMEIVNDAGEVTTIVDYAHTPDSLRCALESLRYHFKGKIWCVFGCGGNRDEGKRPLMGEIAESFADCLVVTDDNPRTEVGDRIVSQILSGVRKPQDVSVIRDRSQAIRYAISNASLKDLVFIAGKGHENYQEVSGIKTCFSDKAHARLALKARGNSR